MLTRDTTQSHKQQQNHNITIIINHLKTIIIHLRRVITNTDGVRNESRGISSGDACVCVCVCFKYVLAVLNGCVTWWDEHRNTWF